MGIHSLGLLIVKFVDVFSEVRLSLGASMLTFRESDFVFTFPLSFSFWVSKFAFRAILVAEGKKSPVASWTLSWTDFPPWFLAEMFFACHPLPSDNMTWAVWTSSSTKMGMFRLSGNFGGPVWAGSTSCFPESLGSWITAMTESACSLAPLAPPSRVISRSGLAILTSVPFTEMRTESKWWTSRFSMLCP